MLIPLLTCEFFRCILVGVATSHILNAYRGRSMSLHNFAVVHTLMQKQHLKSHWKKCSPLTSSGWSIISFLCVIDWFIQSWMQHCNSIRPILYILKWHNRYYFQCNRPDYCTRWFVSYAKKKMQISDKQVRTFQKSFP